MSTLQRIPLTRHTRRRTARDTKARIEALQRMALQGIADRKAAGEPGLFGGIRYYDHGHEYALSPNDRIEVERSWRGPYMWRVVAYREQP
jgi:hypothetical protein